MRYSILGFSQLGVSLMASKALNGAAGWESRVELLVCKVSDTHAVGHGTLPHTKPEAVGNLLSQALSWISGSNNEP